jgi:hypothetical protein
LMLTKKGDRRTKPLRPPVRPLHRLETGTPHTTRHLKSCPIMVVIIGSAAKAGRAGRRKSASGGCPFRDQGIEGAPAFDAH